MAENIMVAVGTILFVAMIVIVGAMVYGYTALVTPHDTNVTRDDVVSGWYTYTSANGVETDYCPILNDTNFVCYNSTGTIVRWAGGAAGYNVVAKPNCGFGYINFTNVAAGAYRDVWCRYTYDWATNDQESFHQTNVSNTGAAFALTAVVGIILAAVAIISVVVLMRGD